MQKLRWGIIGAGRIAASFAEDMRLVTNAELTAVAARERKNARLFADKHAVEKAYGGYQSLFDDRDLDAVYIATPHSFHQQNVQAAMAAGKAVLCEKPLTINADQCRQLMDAATTHQRYLAEGMWTWFLPAIQKAQQWIKAGRIGAIKHIKADFGYPLPYSPDLREYDARVGGGSLLEMGVYPVALTVLLMDEEPQQIHAIGRQADNGVTDDLAFTFNYRDSVATLGTSFRCKLQNWAYIIGETGYIAIPDFWRASQCHLYRLDDCVDSFDDRREGLGFNFEIEEVSADILAGKTQSDRVPLNKSLKVQELMDKVKACSSSPKTMPN